MAHRAPDGTLIDFGIADVVVERPPRHIDHRGSLFEAVVQFLLGADYRCIPLPVRQHSQPTWPGAVASGVARHGPERPSGQAVGLSRRLGS